MAACMRHPGERKAQATHTHTPHHTHAAFRLLTCQVSEEGVLEQLQGARASRGVVGDAGGDELTQAVALHLGQSGGRDTLCSTTATAAAGILFYPVHSFCCVVCPVIPANAAPQQPPWRHMQTNCTNQTPCCCEVSQGNNASLAALKHVISHVGQCPHRSLPHLWPCLATSCSSCSGSSSRATLLACTKLGHPHGYVRPYRSCLRQCQHCCQGDRENLGLP